MTQHYDFAHRLLAEFVLTRPRKRVEQLLTGRAANSFLEDLWDEAGDDPLAGAPDDDDAFMQALLNGDFDREKDSLPQTTSVSLSNGDHAVVITMPTPESATEPHYIAVVFEPRVRYFLLERSDDLSGQEDGTMFCEWTLSPGRTHLNFGPNSLMDASEFMRAVEEAAFA